VKSKLERIWKEAAIAELYVLSHRLVGTSGKETRKLCQVSRYSGRDSKEALPEYKRFRFSQLKCNII
jgi:hypothetical protein